MLNHKALESLTLKLWIILTIHDGPHIFTGQKFHTFPPKNLTHENNTYQICAHDFLCEISSHVQ